ncbi:MAG TPA: hypothetical protein DCX39_02665 [Firmicutes bacterium]|nr:hypothetical protein [Bacillota bacterium]HAX00048.1 hypothetical protein [Bacillota bacterium]
MKNKQIIMGLCGLLLVGGTNLITSCTNKNPANNSSSSLVSVDKLPLDRRITYVTNNMINDEYANAYTKESYENLINALNDARSVLIKDNVTQEELDSALASLNEAVNGLTPREVSNVTTGQISSFIDSMNGNYTLTITDYNVSKDSPVTRTYKAIENAYYNENNNTGYVIYDSYVHSFSLKDTNLKINSAVIGDSWTYPAYILANEFYDRFAAVFGKTEPLSSNGLDVYGWPYSKHLVNTNTFVIDNSNYVAFLLDTMFDVYSYDFDDLSPFGNYVGFDLTDNKLTAYIANDSKLTDVTFKFTFSDINKTKIDPLTNYLSNNKTYSSDDAYNPTSKIEDILSKNSNEKYGLKVDVYNGKDGINDSVDYSVYNVVNDKAAYWVVNDKALVLNNDKTYLAKFENNTITMGEENDYGISDMNLIKTLLSKKDNLQYNSQIDEYFIDIKDSPLTRNALAYFFDISNNTNYTKDDITKVSLKVNGDNELVISLWTKYKKTSTDRDGLILTGVVKQYEGVSISSFDDQTSSLKESLNKLITQYQNVLNEPVKYTTYSFEKFKTIYNKAQELANDEKALTNDLSNIIKLLPLRYNELELAGQSFNENGVNDIKAAYNNLYSDEYSSTPNSYKLSVSYGDRTVEYVYNSSYYYNITDNSGVIKLESFLYDFKIIDGKVTLLSPKVTVTGASQRYLSRVASLVGSYSSLTTDDEYNDLSFTRISSTNDYYIKNPSYLNFFEELYESSVSGLTVSTSDNKITFKAYNSLKLSSITDETLLLNECLATATVSEINSANYSVLDEFLSSSEAIVSKESIVSYLNDNDFTSYSLTKNYGDKTLTTYVTDKYYYSEYENYNEDEEVFNINVVFYALINGTVKKVTIYFDNQHDSLYGVESVTINGNECTSIADFATATLNNLKNITADSLTGTSRFNYDLSDTVFNDLLTLTKEDSDEYESAKITLIDNSLLISFDDGYGNLAARYSLVSNVEGNSFYEFYFNFIISSEEGTLE